VAFVAPMWNSNTARYSEKWVKFFGLPKEELDAAKKVNYTILILVVALVQKYGMMLENIQINAGMHSCGILISEEPLQIIPF
jgi:DNA polymerase III alpha subunit